MKAAIIDNPRKISIREFSKPVIEKYEILFKTKACSICTIDKRAYLGTRATSYPFLGGHECSGIAEDVGEGVVDIKKGDHILLTSAYCMQCEDDRLGQETQCKNRKKLPKRIEFEGNILGGGFAEYLVVPAWQCIKTPKIIPFEKTCLCEPLACVIHSINKANIQLANTVLIIGFGVMGYLHLKLSLLKGARVIVSDFSEENRQKAINAGAYKFINPSKNNISAEMAEITSKRGVDIIFNTAPTSSSWIDIYSLLASNGRIIVYSSQNEKRDNEINYDKIHSNEWQVIGSVSPTLKDNQMAVKLIEYGIINTEEIISDIFDFSEITKAFDVSCKPNKYRTIITFK